MIDGYGVFNQSEVWNRAKFFALLNPKIPTLMQVRDPIEIIKHIIGLPWGGGSGIIEASKTLQRKFNLTFDYHYFDCILKQRKQVLALPKYFDGLRGESFIWDSLCNAISPKTLRYVDMQELSKDSAFGTLESLAKYFGFQAPKEQDKDIYAAQHFKGNLSYLWNRAPLELYVNAKDIAQKYSKRRANNIFNPKINLSESIRILFMELQVLDDFVNLTEHFNCLNGVGVYVARNDFEELKADKNLWEATKEYIQEFLDYLNKESKNAQNARITADEVLEFLRKDKESALNLQSVLEAELAHIKANRPDIVESWKYYQEFVKICKKV